MLFQSLNSPDAAATTVLVSDMGMPATVDEVANDLSRGQRVLVFDPLFFGQNVNGSLDEDVPGVAQMLTGLGVRPLGLEAAQLTGVIRWLGQHIDHGTPSPGSRSLNTPGSVSPVQVVTSGPRAETVAMVAAALEPQLFTQLALQQSIASLQDVFDHPAAYSKAPEITCFELYKEFDFAMLSFLTNQNHASSGSSLFV